MSESSVVYIATCIHRRDDRWHDPREPPILGSDRHAGRCNHAKTVSTAVYAFVVRSPPTNHTAHAHGTKRTASGRLKSNMAGRISSWATSQKSSVSASGCVVTVCDTAAASLAPRSRIRKENSAYGGRRLITRLR